MKSRNFLVGTVMLGLLWHTAAAQPSKGKTRVDAPAMESIVPSASTQSNPVLSDLMAFKPEMPLGPGDVLKGYEIAMSLLADKTASDLSVIVQYQQDDQITREQAEYLLWQRYQVAMMQYQVLSALHDVLKHDMDESAQQARTALKTAHSDSVLEVPFPGSSSAR